MWHCDNKGVFSVRSAYYFIQKCVSISAGRVEFSKGMVKEWYFIWKLNLFLRIKFFCWKACRGIFIFCGKLGIRILVFDLSCRICGAMEDSNVYSVFECFIAGYVWNGVRKKWEWRDILFRSSEDWVVMLGEKFDTEDVEECFSIVWNIWILRNNFIFGKLELQLYKVAERAWQFIKVYQEVNE